MTERILKPLSFFEAIKEVAVSYVHVFKPIFWIVVLAAFVQALISLLIPQNPTIGLAVSILASAISMFFYAWILARGDSVLMNRPETTQDALHVAKHRFLPLLGVLALYIILFGAFMLFGFGMQMLGHILRVEYVFAIITLAIVLFVFTLLAFTMPAVVLDKMPILKSFEHSTRLVWGNWWHTFGVFMVFIIPIVLLSLGVLLLPTRNIIIMTLYEFIFHIITYPLMVSLILVLYHDLKTRHQMKGFKHIVEK